MFASAALSLALASMAVARPQQPPTIDLSWMRKAAAVGNAKRSASINVSAP